MIDQEELTQEAVMLGAVFAKREIIKTFDAIGRHDVDAIVRMFHDDGVFEFPGDTVMSGRFQGKEAIRTWLQRWFDRMPEIRFTVRHVSVENIFALGASNVVHVEWNLEEIDREGHPYHLTGVTAFEVVNGKARLVKDYIFDQNLLASIWPPKAAGAGGERLGS